MARDAPQPEALLEAIESAVILNPDFDGSPELCVRAGTVWRPSNRVCVEHPELFAPLGSSTDLKRYQPGG